MNNEEKILAILEKQSELLTQMQKDQRQMRSDMGQMQEEQRQMRSDMGQMQEEQRQMREEQKQMREDITGIKSQQSKMQDDITGIKNQQSKMQDDITGIKNQQSKMQDDITGIKLRLELDIEKRFDTVNEGIDAILAQLTPKRRVEEMEADITVLKTAVKMLTQEVAELKKAQ